jgi:hypothetical protein
MTKRVGVVLGTLLVIAVTIGSFTYFAYFRYTYYRTLNIDDFFGADSETKEKLFGDAPPTGQEIERFFFEATILTSHPPIFSDVTYFDSLFHFFEWSGKDILKGRWSTYPVTLTRTYRGHSRVDVAQIFCRELDGETLMEGSCKLIIRMSQLFFEQGSHERTSGDIFNLSHSQRAPFAIPSTEITLARLTERLHADPTQ